MKLTSFAAVLVFLLAPVALHCGVLEQMTADGSLRRVAAPRFTDPGEAKAFAAKCRALAAEIEQNYAPTPHLAALHKQAVLAGEFLTGRPYVLKTTHVPSVVRLREWVKAPAPDAVAYVRVYPSREAAPAFVQSAFERPETRGVTIEGRYVAIIQSKYPQEVQDVLSHEMVHCYLSLTSPKPLPQWFQEGSAVYFSTGKERKFYGREAGVPEGVVSALPEDYKNNLFVFSYLEQRVGRPKVYEFVRRALRTGTPDMRIVGFGQASRQAAQQKPQIPKKLIIAAGAGIVFIGAAAAAYVARRREEEF